VAGKRYAITEAVFETPRFGARTRGQGFAAPMPATGLPGVAQMPVPLSGEHDLLGEGWVEVAYGALTVAVRPHGLIGTSNRKKHAHTNSQAL
jgi:hypothetical protein